MDLFLAAVFSFLSSFVVVLVLGVLGSGGALPFRVELGCVLVKGSSSELIVSSSSLERTETAKRSSHVFHVVSSLHIFETTQGNQ